MDDIAKASELARGTLYLYFQNKEDVYALVLEEGLSILQDLIQKSYDPLTDPLTNLLNGHDAFMKFHDYHPNYYKVLNLNSMEFAGKISQEIKARLDEHFVATVSWIAHLLTEGIEHDIFRPMSVQEVAMVQIGISMGFAQIVDKSATCQNVAIDRSSLRQAHHDLIANSVLKRSK